MTPEEFCERVIDPGLDFLASIAGPVATPNVRRFLLCIALQESGPKLDARYQGSPGATPSAARGFFQFEQGGGVAGVLTHAASKTLALDVCAKLTVVPQAAAVWRALEGSDLLAAAFARLLIFTDPKSIPTTEQVAWEYYLRVWRPGKPHRDAWTGNWKTADNMT